MTAQSPDSILSGKLNSETKSIAWLVLNRVIAERLPVKSFAMLHQNTSPSYYREMCRRNSRSVAVLVVKLVSWFLVPKRRPFICLIRDIHVEI